MDVTLFKKNKIFAYLMQMWRTHLTPQDQAPSYHHLSAAPPELHSTSQRPCLSSRTWSPRDSSPEVSAATAIPTRHLLSEEALLLRLCRDEWRSSSSSLLLGPTSSSSTRSRYSGPVTSPSSSRPSRSSPLSSSRSPLNERPTRL